MSRPFSYNDENFTVIGNILFVHLNIDNKAYSKGDKIGIIPSAIYDRIFTRNSIASVSNNAVGSYSSLIYIYIDDDRNIVIDGSISITSYLPRVIYTWILLKDI